MMTSEMEYYWDELVEMEIATAKELGLATALCGCTIETLESVLYIRTGYRSFEQLYEDLYAGEEDS